MSEPALSGIVITFNEENNILEVVESLRQVCDEVVVVDSCSTDNTVKLAQEAGAKVVIQPYLGDGFQKNVALKHVKNLWVLSLDADERLTPELVGEIRKIDFSTTPFDGFQVRRKNFIGTRWIKTCGWYPDYLVRIYRHDKLKYPEVKAHAAVPHDNTHRLNADIEHRTYSSITEMFAKQIEKFSTRSAKILYEKGRKISPFAPFFHGMHTFFLNYFIRKGFLGGIDGLSISIAMAVNSYLKYAKVIEWQRNPEMTETEDFNNSLW
ncbi:MAG: glycosyltransferase family 2 protein [Bacteroidales bacterium]|nr:glycosyltransferase family 2 protein [Bacteroidales bacterium]MDY6348733.1 glycosyltransferase family 2 protein [Bacteroidales bacterium]